MSSELLTPYDPAKYLTDDEDLEVFLADAEGTGDAGYIARARKVAERAKTMNQAKYQASSDNVYANLDLPEAETMQAKAQTDTGLDQPGNRGAANAVQSGGPSVRPSPE